jgi:hypothetical protein
VRRARQRGVARSRLHHGALRRWPSVRLSAPHRAPTGPRQGPDWGGRRGATLRKIRPFVETAATVAHIHSSSRSVRATTGESEPLRTGSDAGAGRANRTQPRRAPGGPEIVDFKKYSV